MRYSLKKMIVAAALVCAGFAANAQKYNGVIDRSVAVVGGEMIALSDIEQQVQMMRAKGMSSDRKVRCEILEEMMSNKLFLMQARVDSLTINNASVDNQLNGRMDEVRTALGGDEEVAKYFGKPIYKLRQEWKQQYEELSLTQQEQGQIAAVVPDMTPYDVRQYLDTVDHATLPIVPIKYQLSQICVYPDREAAAMAVKEKLLELRERIINGEKFSRLALMYSEDPGSARKGGELGMASKNIFWPAFSDAAMSLKPGVISQIVETPDGFHIIEIIEKKGDMFNARHILIKPKYTSEDQKKAFATLDSLRTEINNGAVSFELAARFYSEDLPTKTNGGQMADPNTGSAYFEKDQIKAQDFRAVQNLQEGEISEPIASLDNEGRDGNLIYKIIRLDKILPSHQATFENDFNLLAAQVKSEKQMKEIDKFIDEKIKSTYIVIDPMFADCEFRREGWSEKVRKSE